MSLTQKFKLNGLTCNACKILSERRIKKISGVEEVVVELNSGILSLNATREIALIEIQEVLKETNYTVTTQLS